MREFAPSTCDSGRTGQPADARGPRSGGGRAGGAAVHRRRGRARCWSAAGIRMRRSCRCARSPPTAATDCRSSAARRTCVRACRWRWPWWARICRAACAIKRAKLRGLESFGMLCSARELGLGNGARRHHGAAGNAGPRAQFARGLDLDDTMLEVNATPNRGDCMSVFGIARDYAAAHTPSLPDVHAPPVAAQNDAVHFRCHRGGAGLPGLRLPRDSRRQGRRCVAGCGCASGCAASASTAFRPSSTSPIT